MKKILLIIGLVIISQKIYSHNLEDSPRIVNQSTIPLAFVIMYSATRQESITVQPRETYTIQFTPPSDSADYPDVKINYSFDEVKLPLRVLITKDPDDGCNTEYGISHPSKLNMSWYTPTGSKIWEFTTHVSQR